MFTAGFHLVPWYFSKQRNLLPWNKSKSKAVVLGRQGLSFNERWGWGWIWSLKTWLCSCTWFWFLSQFVWQSINCFQYTCVNTLFDLSGLTMSSKDTDVMSLVRYWAFRGRKEGEMREAREWWCREEFSGWSCANSIHRRKSERQNVSNFEDFFRKSFVGIIGVI